MDTKAYAVMVDSSCRLPCDLGIVAIFRDRNEAELFVQEVDIAGVYFILDVEADRITLFMEGDDCVLETYLEEDDNESINS